MNDIPQPLVVMQTLQYCLISLMIRTKIALRLFRSLKMKICHYKIVLLCRLAYVVCSAVPVFL